MNRKALLANALGAILIALLLNGIIFFFHWDQTDSGNLPPWFSPPDWFVGAVWVVLFAGMGAARWLALRRGATRPALWVAILFLVCALYPFYTGGFRLLPGFIGNLVTVALAAWVATRLWPHSRPAAALVLCVVLWVSFATVVVAAELHWL
ncbi:MAG: TspO/MBR family protein [Bryobacteraceae bacterium]